MDFEQINILFSNSIEYSKYMINIVLSWKNWNFSLSHFQPNWLSKSTYLKFVFSRSAIILFIFFIFVLFLLFLFHFTSTLHFHFLNFFSYYCTCNLEFYFFPLYVLCKICQKTGFLRFCPNTEIHRPDDPRILAYFIQWSISPTTNVSNTDIFLGKKLLGWIRLGVLSILI